MPILLVQARLALCVSSIPLSLVRLALCGALSLFINGVLEVWNIKESAEPSLNSLVLLAYGLTNRTNPTGSVINVTRLSVTIRYVTLILHSRFNE